MSKKKTKKIDKKLNKKLKKLNERLYDNNKYVSREEFLIKKLSGRILVYYNNLSDERKKAFINYIIKQEDYNSRHSLERLEKEDNKIEPLTDKKCGSISELISNIKKNKNKKKKERKKIKNIIKTKDGLHILLNPEAYDVTLLKKKDYRKFLSKLASKEKENPITEIDCTLKNFKKQLMKNDNVNQAVMDAFWNKSGY